MEKINESSNGILKIVLASSAETFNVSVSKT